MRRTILLMLLLLAGCGNFGRQPADNWTRGETTPDQLAADLRACRHSAQAKVDMQMQIDQDMGADPTGQGGLINNLDQYDSEKQFDQLTRDCMLAQGYVPAGPTGP